MAVDGDRIYNDLRDHFGTGSMQFPFMVAALGELDAAYQRGDWDHIISLALDEGFDMESYRV